MWGGLKALIEHPEQAERLRRDPQLTPRAVEEIVRWTTPVNYMTRLAAHDVDYAGHEVKKGQKLALFYASANRDESVFDRPFDFDITRHPNRHLGFGIGEHFCLGANLARKSSRALFRELVTRLESAELGAPCERTASSFVAGIKHLPVRLEISPHA